jgi:hypothetical protein
MLLRVGYQNDKAVMEFGNIKNLDVTTGSNTSSILSIRFCASLIDPVANVTPVYLTAGADYADETYIWIGQDQLTPDYTNRAVNTRFLKILF